MVDDCRVEPLEREKHFVDGAPKENVAWALPEVSVEHVDNDDSEGLEQCVGAPNEVEPNAEYVDFNGVIELF